ncbi:MAG: hypothetical protein JXB04_08580 [Kiritimatiellae bacterium]|nr:hypothetical protein [Kiritimatiellia bacterium]
MRPNGFAVTALCLLCAILPLAAAAQEEPVAGQDENLGEADLTEEERAAAPLDFGTNMGSRVTVEKTATGYQLVRNGEPYFIKGAGYRTHMDEIVAAGANSIRTWSASHLESLLNQAHERGLSVCVGLWLAHERHGFDYSDEKKVKQQLEKARFYVNRYKHHPALLMWGVGNETEWISGTNALVYKAIDDIAVMIKQEDPHHPTLTVVGEIGTNELKIAFLKEHCPHIDILGVNSFGGLRTLPDRIKQSGWEKPYVVTEFGPIGPWEAQKTPWGSEIEQTSSAKARYYYGSYTRGIKDQPLCLGSYVFLWGFKHETTPTWFSMYLPDGSKLGPVDYMTYAWSGRWPANKAPDLKPIQCPLAQSRVRRLEDFEASVEVSDPNNDPLAYEWEVMSETRKRNRDGTFSTSMRRVTGCIQSNAENRIYFKTPERPGMFRLFVYVRDGKGAAATHNVPFFVE